MLNSCGTKHWDSVFEVNSGSKLDYFITFFCICVEEGSGGHELKLD